MDRTNAINSVGGLYRDPDVGLGLRGTTLTARDRNLTQEEIVNAVLGAGLTLSENDETQLLQAIQILGNQDMGVRNEFVNPGCFFNQRGGNPYSITAGDGAVYTLDQWLANAGGPGGSMQVSQVSLVQGTAGNPDAGSSALQTQQIIAAVSSTPYIAQRVARLGMFSGRTITVSWYARATAGSPQSITPEVRQVFGAGGSSDVSILGSPQAIDGSWARFEESFDVPSDDGKTYGTSGAYLEVRLNLPLSTTPTVQFTQMQLEVGSSATPIETRSRSLEYLLCSQFFQKSYSLNAAPGAVSSTGQITFEGSPSGSGGVWQCGRVLLPMRTIPTMTWYSPITGDVNKIDWSGERAVVDTLYGHDRYTGVPQVSTDPGVTAFGRAHFTAEATY